MPEIARNEPVTPDNALVPDGMTPPSREEAVRQKSYAQMRRERETTNDERERETLRLRAEHQALPDHLSVVTQGRVVRAKRSDVGPEQFHYEDIELLPGFTVDDARKLKGGEGAQFRTDAVKMVEVETNRVAQLHEIVGTDDVWLACDGTIMDPADFTSLDAALAAAQEQVIAGEDEGDSDVKEIALVSAALMETARYQAVAGAEQAPPPPELLSTGEKPAYGQDVLVDPPIGQTAEPQWKTGA